MRSRAWVKVGTPAAEASAATATYSSGVVPGAYPSSRPIPSAPSAMSDSRILRTRPISVGVAARCHRGSPRLAHGGSTEPPALTPASTLILASAQEAANP
jgi:hypothetical protein